MTPDLHTVLTRTVTTYASALETYVPNLRAQEVGTVLSVGHGIALVDGLPGLQAEELVRFPHGVWGMALNLDPDVAGVALLDDAGALEAGDEVHRTRRVLDVPVGADLLGRIVDPLGRPLDDRGPLRTTARRPLEREAPAIMDRAPVTVPLQTGLKVVDALLPIGRGQRELILGDRQTGKTAVALDAMLNQADHGVLCVYCAIGQREAAVANVVAELRAHDALAYTIIVVASGDDAAGLQFVAPYAATTMAEYFMEQGRDVLIVYDDLTRHARAYRELSLLLRRPPGREAYPGDIFYIHSRLLERATHLGEQLGGGSLTALPIVETQAQNLTAYIPTNLISITDGQIYLSPTLFQKGILPAVDVGRSVSRVGGKAQLPAYRALTGDLRLAYTQFQELEAFARFGTRLDPETRQALHRGVRVREVLKQPQYAPIPVAQQIAVLLAVVEGLFDALDLPQLAEAEATIHSLVHDEMSALRDRIQKGQRLSTEDRAYLKAAIQRLVGAPSPEATA